MCVVLYFEIKGSAYTFNYDSVARMPLTRLSPEREYFAHIV